jgi:hypothetical protein
MRYGISPRAEVGLGELIQRPHEIQAAINDLFGCPAALGAQTYEAP